jgi:hypothetical protein
VIGGPRLMISPMLEARSPSSVRLPDIRNAYSSNDRRDYVALRVCTERLWDFHDTSRFEGLLDVRMWEGKHRTL